MIDADDLEQYELALLLQACRRADRLDELGAAAGNELVVGTVKGDLAPHPALVDHFHHSARGRSERGSAYEAGRSRGADLAGVLLPTRAEAPTNSSPMSRSAIIRPFSAANSASADRVVKSRIAPEAVSKTSSAAGGTSPPATRIA